MHLALELGCTVTELEERMPEREFLLWQMFNARHLLPGRRVELALGNIARWVGITMGGVNKNEPLKSFLIEPTPIVDGTASMDAATGGAILSGFTSVGMYRLGQGRKLKKVK